MTDELKLQVEKIDRIVNFLLTCYASDIKTQTTPSVCKDLVNLKFNPNFTIIDICCGRGTILLEWFRQCWISLDIKDKEEKNKFIFKRIHGIDIDEMQLDMARTTLIRVQKALGIQDIQEPFLYNLDVLNHDLKYFLPMKFDCVITNPPYNSERGDNNQSMDIYPQIIEKAFDLSSRYVIMITKSNWMNLPSHSDFREKMINTFNVDKIVHYPVNPFKGTEIKGGVSYFVIDNQNTKETFELNGVTYDRTKALSFLPYDLNKQELNLLNKILTLKKVDLTNFRAQGYYSIKTNDPKLSKENVQGTIICHVSEQKGKIQFYPLTGANIKILQDLAKPKLITPSKYSPYKIGRVIQSTTNEVCSESMVSWTFDTVEEMNNYYQYMNTKLFRVCFSLISNNARVGKTAFSLVPEVDFTKLDKIDDNSIYDYFSNILTQNDVKTIEERFNKLQLM